MRKSSKRIIRGANVNISKLNFSVVKPAIRNIQFRRVIVCCCAQRKSIVTET